MDVLLAAAVSTLLSLLLCYPLVGGAGTSVVLVSHVLVGEMEVAGGSFPPVCTLHWLKPTFFF